MRRMYCTVVCLGRYMIVMHSSMQASGTSYSAVERCSRDLKPSVPRQMYRIPPPPPRLCCCWCCMSCVVRDRDRDRASLFFFSRLRVQQQYVYSSSILIVNCIDKSFISCHTNQQRHRNKPQLHDSLRRPASRPAGAIVQHRRVRTLRSTLFFFFFVMRSSLRHT